MKLFYTLVAAVCIAQLQAAETTKKVNIDQVSVELLKDHPEQLDCVVRLWYETQGKDRYSNFEQIKESQKELIKSRMQDKQLPLMLIALFNAKAIGYCTLMDTCIKEGALSWADANPNKKPWVALSVAHDYQRKGVGTKLATQAMRYAKDTFSFNKAYILAYPETAAVYEGKGCVKTADTSFAGKPAVIMEVAFDKVLKENV